MNLEDYTKIPTQLLEDKITSFACRGMIIYLLSYKNYVDIQFTDGLIKSSGGQKKFDKLIKEAISVGYLIPYSDGEKDSKTKYRISEKLLCDK